MKPWMKILMWFGLGAGIGFFAGEQVGRRSKRKDDISQTESCSESYLVEAVKIDHVDPDYTPVLRRIPEDIGLYANKAAAELAKEYKADTDGDEVVISESDLKIDEFDDPQDPKTTDIPQLHPTQMLPQIVTEEEYYNNPWEYDDAYLLYYEQDDVLYDPSHQDVIQNPDDLIGIATLLSFHQGPGKDLDTIFVINEKFGTRFRIDRLTEAFCDSVDGLASPPDDEEEDDDEYE